MSTTICPHCKTFNGVKAQTSWNGRKKKPLICGSAHVAPIATCDVCAVVTPILTTYRTSYEGKRSYAVASHHEAHGGPWEHLPIGNVTRTFGERNQYVEEKKVHVCAECADAVRLAMQVAFDQCSGARAGIRGGTVLDATAPNRVIVAAAALPTETMTKTVTRT